MTSALTSVSAKDVEIFPATEMTAWRLAPVIAALDELAGEGRGAGVGLAEQGLDRLGRDAPGVAEMHGAVGEDGRQAGQVDLVRRQLVLALPEPAALEADDLGQGVADREATRRPGR